MNFKTYLTRPKIAKHSQGFVLIIVLIAALVLSALALLMIRQSDTDVKSSHGSVQLADLAVLADRTLNDIGKDGKASPWLLALARAAHREQQAQTLMVCAEGVDWQNNLSAQTQRQCAFSGISKVQVLAAVQPLSETHFLAKSALAQYDALRAKSPDADASQPTDATVYHIIVSAQAVRLRNPSQAAAARACMQPMQPLVSLRCLYEQGVAARAAAREFVVVLDNDAPHGLLQAVRWYELQLVRE